MNLDHVPGRSGFFRDDGDLPSCDGIQETGLAGIGRPHQHHLQAGPVVRDRTQAGKDGARAGLVVRGASRWVVGQPSPTGKLAMSWGLLETTWLHYGLTRRRDGQWDLSPLSPALHWGRGARAVTVGAFPEIGLRYHAGGSEMVWSGLLVVQSSQLPRLE